MLTSFFSVSFFLDSRPIYFSNFYRVSHLEHHWANARQRCGLGWENAHGKQEDRANNKTNGILFIFLKNQTPSRWRENPQYFFVAFPLIFFFQKHFIWTTILGLWNNQWRKLKAFFMIWFRKFVDRHTAAAANLKWSWVPDINLTRHLGKFYWIF